MSKSERERESERARESARLSKSERERVLLQSALRTFSYGPSFWASTSTSKSTTSASSTFVVSDLIVSRVKQVNPIQKKQKKLVESGTKESNGGKIFQKNERNWGLEFCFRSHLCLTSGSLVWRRRRRRRVGATYQLFFSLSVSSWSKLNFWKHKKMNFPSSLESTPSQLSKNPMFWKSCFTRFKFLFKSFTGEFILSILNLRLGFADFGWWSSEPSYSWMMIWDKLGQNKTKALFSDSSKTNLLLFLLFVDQKSENVRRRDESVQNFGGDRLVFECRQQR